MFIIIIIIIIVDFIFNIIIRIIIIIIISIVIIISSSIIMNIISSIIFIIIKLLLTLLLALLLASLLTFFLNISQQVIDCRRVLKYSYALGYFLENDSLEKQLFEHHQELLEKNTEKLHEYTEQSLDVIDRTQVSCTCAVLCVRLFFIVRTSAELYVRACDVIWERVLPLGIYRCTHFEDLELDSRLFTFFCHIIVSPY